MLTMTPLLGLLALLPAHPSTQAWRFSAEGLLANLLLLPTVGVALAMVVAAALQHRRLLRALTILSALAAIALVVLLVRLGLDALQLRHEIAVVQARVGGRASSLRGFDLNVLKAALEYSVAAAAAAIFAWRGQLAARALRPGRAKGAVAAGPVVLATAPAKFGSTSSTPRGREARAVALDVARPDDAPSTISP